MLYSIRYVCTVPPVLYKIPLVVMLPCPIQGVYARGLMGNASSAKTQLYKAVVEPLAHMGCSFIE